LGLPLVFFFWRRLLFPHQVDSGVNSNPESLARVRAMVTPMQAGNLFVHNLDLCDAVALKATLRAISQTKKIDACVHFAGLKAVGESTKMPLRYHQNNVAGTLNLLQVVPSLKSVTGALRSGP
jgi:UDP-glucose 4-epimerase